MTLKQHPLAKLIPPHGPSENEAQEDSLLESGQLDDITLYEGMIFDGWGRYNKLLKLGKTPRFKEFHSNGVTPLGFLKAKLSGRHLNDSQKACIALSFQRELTESYKEKLRNKRDNRALPVQGEGGTSREKTAKSFGLGIGMMQKALTVWNRDKAIFDRCFRGEISLFKGLKLTYPKKMQMAVEPIPTENSSTPNDLVLPDMFSSGYETLEEFILSMNKRGWKLVTEAFGGKFYSQFYGHKVAKKTSWSPIDGLPKYRASIVTAAREVLK